MKIPETSANVGAYYGNEENGQWQPNGVIIDSGVGGGVVGSGDAGLHRPVYPVHHIPRGPHHMPGYVMAGAYYGPMGGGVGAGAAGYAHAQGPQPEDFSDYMWMENEEEFDKQVMQQLEEEALMEQCIEAMLEDEQRERTGQRAGGQNPETSNGTSLSLEETVSRSTLNPLAAEFVPTFVSRRPTPDKEDKTEPVAEAPTTEVPTTKAIEEHKAENDTQPAANRQTEVPDPQPDPPEVSAADVQPERVRRDSKKENKKTDKKQETKKPKPTTTKSETKVQPKKKEPVKAVKSESRVNDVNSTPAVAPVAPVAPSAPVAPVAPVNPVAPAAPAAPVAPVIPAPPAPATVESAPSITEVTKAPQPTPVEEILSGPKPINYAAAAKANKPKKPPTVEKTPPPQTPLPPQPSIVDKKAAGKPKDTQKPLAKEKPRKNSAK